MRAMSIPVLGVNVSELAQYIASQHNVKIFTRK